MPIGNVELQAFLATLLGKLDLPGGNGGRWAEECLACRLRGVG